MKKPNTLTERGAVAIEYGLIGALIFIVIIGAMQQMGTNTNSMYINISNKIGGAMR